MSEALPQDRKQMNILSSKQRSRPIGSRTRTGEPPHPLTGCRSALATDGRRRAGVGGFHHLLSRLCLSFFTCLLLFQAGCALRIFSPNSPKAQVGSLSLGTNMPASVTLDILQAQVMRFADVYVATVAQACDDITANSDKPDLRLAALQWKVGQATSAFTDATGSNPALNALDMLVLVTMARMVVEEYGVEKYGDDIRPLLNAQRNLETNAWTLASGMLRPSQQAELRDMISAWREKNPHQRYIGPIRFREFVTAMGKNPTPATTAPTSIFSLLFLDPLAGLDPTAAAIQETRDLGERAMYYSQRTPQLLSWQTQELAVQLASQPESRQVLSNVQQVAVAATSFAKVSEQFPQLVNDQRQAAIQQVLDGLSNQMADAHQTLVSGDQAVTNLNNAIQSLTEFVRYVYPTNASAAATDTNSRPFNVLDYGTAAAQVGAAANNLNTLLTTINESVPQLAQLQRQSADEANRVVDHAFWRALVLIIVFLAGAVAAACIWRMLVNKSTLAGTISSASKS
jgi:hypothetical protein